MQRRCTGGKTKGETKKTLTTLSCCNLSKQGSSCGTAVLLWIVVITSRAGAPDDIRFESLAPILLLLLQAPFFCSFCLPIAMKNSETLQNHSTENTTEILFSSIQDILRRQTNSSPFSSEDLEKSVEICLLQDTSQDSRTNKQTQNPSSRLSAIALKKKP